jgi:hypothetical protein
LQLYSIEISYSIWIRVIASCVNYNFVRCIVHVRMFHLDLFYCHAHWFCCVYLYFNFVFLCLLKVAWKVYFIHTTIITTITVLHQYIMVLTTGYVTIHYIIFNSEIWCHPCTTGNRTGIRHTINCSNSKYSSTYCETDSWWINEFKL